MNNQIPCDYDWISVHGPNLRENISGYADKEANELKAKILNAPNTEELYEITGVKYYFASDGDDVNDGLSPEKPLKSLEFIDKLPLKEGDAILFRRNSVFRVKNTIWLSTGVTYGSYGEGEKPRFYASPRDYAIPEYWNPTHKENVWKTQYLFTEACGVFFDHGKDIGTLWMGGIDALKKNFDYHFDKEKGILYLYFDKGNPADFYKSIEITPRLHHMFRYGDAKNTVIDNLCIKFTGGFPIAATGENHTITNCEMGYVGGLWQIVVRFGNAIEFYGAAVNVKIENNWIYQTFDSAISWQGMNENGRYENISFSNNLLEYNNADIEFFGRGESVAKNFFMENNIMRFTSMGWGTHDEERGVRGIEGCVKAHTHLMAPTGYMTYKNNIMDCPARDIICWRVLPENKDFIDASGNKVYVKSALRTNDIAVRGLIDENSGESINYLANNSAELEEAFKRLSNDTETHWFDE